MLGVEGDPENKECDLYSQIIESLDTMRKSATYGVQTPFSCMISSKSFNLFKFNFLIYKIGVDLV